MKSHKQNPLGAISYRIRFEKFSKDSDVILFASLSVSECTRVTLKIISNSFSYSLSVNSDFLSILEMSVTGFYPGREGLIFVSKTEDVPFVTCNVEVQRMLTEVRSEAYEIVFTDIRNESSRKEDIEEHMEKAKAAVFEVDDFRPCHCEVKGMFPYILTRKERLSTNVGFMLKIFVRAFMEGQRQNEIRVICRALPFTTCCASNVRKIIYQIPTLLKRTIEVLAAEKQKPLQNVPCVLNIDIRCNNEILERKSEIEAAFMTEFQKHSDKLTYKSDLEELIRNLHNFKDLPTIVFHITVLGGQAYLGAIVDADKCCGHALESYVP